MGPYLLHVLGTAAILLIGLWDYFSTHWNIGLVPLLFSGVFILFFGAFKSLHKQSMVVVLFLHFMLISMLFQNIIRAISTNNHIALIRVLIVIGISLFSINYFYRYLRREL